MIVTDAPTAPEGGDTPEIVGVGSTVKLEPLLFTPLALTTTLPVVAPLGTIATIDVALQLLMVVAVVTLNFTVPLPWVAPKFVPVIVTDAPTAPEVGDKLVMLGAATTVNDDPALATPLTVTTTLPVVAPARNRRHDRRGAPTGDGRNGSGIELDRARALRRPEVRSRNRDRCAYRT